MARQIHEIDEFLGNFAYYDDEFSEHEEKWEDAVEMLDPKSMG